MSIRRTWLLVGILIGVALADSLLFEAGGTVSFSFAAAGDLGETSATSASLTRLAASGSAFFLAVGDLSYTGSLGQESIWCDFVKARVGPSYPFQLLAGNHESDGRNGLIDNFAQCLPDRIGVTGEYAKQYYFDYPAADPLARFILISPALTFTNGGTFNYRVGDARYNWLAGVIDGARSAGIPWVIVGMHKACISTGGTSCDVGQDLIDLLMAKKVDLVIQGHAHNYQRMKQLRCAIRNFYVPDCVAGTGPSGIHTKGAGTVFIISGNGGASLATISATDPENPYFATAMGSGTPGAGSGFLKYTVHPDRIDAETSFDGTYQDRFTISRSPAAGPLDARFDISPRDPVAGESVLFSATVTGGTAPYSYSWTFGDGATASGPMTAHVFGSTGTFAVGLTVRDAVGATSTSSRSLSVGAPPAPPRSFSFGAAGDMGQTADTSATLTRISTSGTAFFVVVGDLSENSRGEAQWCSFVTSILGTAYPFQLLSGDEEDNGPSGLIDNFAACLPNKVGPITGTYAKEYYFDFPAASPLARFILISPSLSFTNGGTFSYTAVNSRFTWVSNAIDDARARDIPWVIVGMHRNCITMGNKACQPQGIGQDLMDLLTAKRVDLILQGNDENYQRSKQLACAIRTVFVPDCISNDGATALYTKGQGPVVVIAGTGGDDLDPVSSTDTEAGYFATSMGETTPGAGFGFLKYSVYADRIEAETSFSGAYADRFRIVNSVLTGSFTVSPADPVEGEPVTFQATTVGGRPPYAFEWNFGDGTTDTGSFLTHVFRSAGAFTVTLTIRDSGSQVAIATRTVTVGPAGPPPLAAGFEFTPGQPVVAEPVTFRATVTGGTPPYTLAWAFGDSGTGSGEVVDHAYASAGTFDVVLTVTDAAGNGVTASRAVAVAPELVATFAVSPASPTAGEPVTFSASADGGVPPYAFDWDFGDGSTGTGPTVDHTFAAGLYSVSLTVHDSAGHAASSSQTVAVAAPLTADFSFDPATPAVGDDVVFSAIVGGGNAPYVLAWDFGDGATGSGADAVHRFASAGPFVVELAAQDADGRAASASKTIVVAGALSVDFTFDPPNPAAGDAIAFTAAVSGGTPPYAVAWDFGDGNTATGDSALHAYAAAEIFSVTVSATDAEARSASRTRSVLVTDALEVDFTFSPASPAVAETVTFVGTASGGTAPLSFSWTFGDGNTGSGETPVHAYGGTGIFDVTLVVQDSAGHIASITKPITISAVLFADFAYAPPTPVVGETVSFSAIATGGSEPYAFAWDFGDGGTASEASATHAYSAAGVYVVRLVVSDSDTQTAIVEKRITVVEPLAASFTATPAAPAAGEDVVFTASASGGTEPYSFTWDLGDGTSAEGQTVTHRYPAGRFDVTVTVLDSSGQRASSTESLTVHAVLGVTFVFAPVAPVVGESVAFLASASGGAGPYAFEWDFGDGHVDVGPSVGHAYEAIGVFLVTLTVRDATGQVAIHTESVGVTPVLTASFVVSPSVPIAGRAASFAGEAAGGTPAYGFSWDFGDGETAAGESVLHAYASAGTYTVLLTVRDSAGHITTASLTLTVVDPLDASFTFAPVEPVQGERISFFGSSSGGQGPISFDWDFGDGTRASGFEATHAHASPGAYVVSLTVRDAGGQEAVASTTILVVPPLGATLGIDPGAPIVGDLVSFSASAEGGSPPYTFAWDFGDGTSGAGEAVTHAYLAAGAYTITLVVGDAAGRSVEVRTELTIYTPLTADFTFAPVEPVLGEAISFVGFADGGVAPLAFAWDFGDGTTGTGSDVGHLYGASGRFTVALTVTDASGRFLVVTHDVTVVAPELVADFRFAPADPMVGEEVLFTATASGGVPPYAFTWDFGDGTTAAGEAAAHTFATSGVRTVVLRVDDSDGRTAIVTAFVDVSARLAADILSSPASPEVGEVIAFSAIVSGGTPPYAFAWDFGDGETATGPDARHTYGAAGLYVVVLTVADGSGRGTTASRTIGVTDRLEAAIAFDPARPIVGEAIAFSGSATGGTPPYSFAWDFGDGNTATGDAVVHAYEAAGPYFVSLVVADAAGHERLVTSTVSVAPALSADFSISPERPIRGETVTFTAEALGGFPGYTFTWNFGDGGTATDGSVAHVYVVAGSYSVSLRVADSAGHEVLIAKTVVVGTPLSGAFAVSPSEPRAGEVVSFGGVAVGGTGPYLFEWDFGDGGTGTGSAAAHVYTSPGEYSVILVVTDLNGRTARAEKTVRVAGSPLAADFAVTPGSPFVGEETTFVAIAVGGSGAYTYVWDFGDGSSGTGATATKTYAVPGIYTVTLTVSDGTQSATVSKEIVVLDNGGILPGSAGESLSDVGDALHVPDGREAILRPGE